MFNVLVKIDGCDPFKMLWSDFASDNADGIDAAELEQAEAELLFGGTVSLGGGAGPFVAVSPVGY